MEDGKELEEEKEVEGKDKAEVDTDDLSFALNAEDFDPEALAEQALKEKGEEVVEEKKEEKVEEKPPEPSEKEKTLEAELSRLKQDKSNLQRALHEERQSKKIAKDPEAVLSDAEILKIMQDNKDDPAVLLNSVKYIVNQAIKTGKKDTVDAVEIRQKQDDMNKLLRTRYGDALDDESSHIRTEINKAKTYLGLSDHPYGDGLGASVVVFAALPQILADAYERGVKDQVEGKVEKARQENLKGGKISVGKKTPELKVDSKTGLSADHMETAKLLGFDKDPKKLQIFKSQILKVGSA